MKNTLLLFILLFIGGCGKDFCPPDKYSRQAFEGWIAYVFNANSVLTPTPDNINPVTPTECKCDKNKTELTGDGILRVRCRCGAACKCHQNDETGLQPEVVADDCDKPRSRQVLYIGQEACQPCREVKSKTFPELTKMNPPWKIGESDKDFIRVLEWTPELGEEHNVNQLPTFILIVDGKEEGRFVGFMNHIQLSNFYYTGNPDIKAKFNDN